MTVSDLSALLARVEAATGADREIDAAVLDAMREHFRAREELVLLTEHLDVPPYTASVDAALALIEAMLPGWNWTALSAAGAEEPMVARIGPDAGRVSGMGATRALALLSALLRALAAGEPA